MTTGAVLEYPLSSVAVTNHADLAYTLPSDPSPSASILSPQAAARIAGAAANSSAEPLSGPLHTHQFIDDDNVRVTGWYPADTTHDGLPLAWDVTFTKVRWLLSLLLDTLDSSALAGFFCGGTRTRSLCP